MKYTEKMSNKLNELLERNYDAEKGYLNASENIESEQLKMYFNERAAQRSQFAKELRTEILMFGQIPDESGSFKGSAHRVWMDIKALFKGNDENAILEECIRGEKAIIDEYNQVLSKQATLPISTANLLVKQRNEIQVAIDNVKWLEEASA